MATIANNLQLVRSRISQACLTVQRPSDSVTLLAVSKTFPAENVRDAFNAGQKLFGENYVQEALDKIEALSDIRAQIEWHLIGPLQSNKTRPVAEAFDWVHTVDRLKIAQRLSEQRPDSMPPLQVCVQVNTSGEDSKSGCAPEEALALAQAVAQLPRLKLRGIMALPAPSPDPAVQHEALKQVCTHFTQWQAAGLDVDTVSMGMSNDLEAAVQEGATMVRIGTAIFGHR